MSHTTDCARRLLAPALVALIASIPSAAAQTAHPAAHTAGKVSISTASAEARADFITGRTLAENLRAHESREFMLMAVSAPTAKEFFDHLRHAVALAEKASPGERLMILGAQAGANADPAKQLELYTRLVKEFPEDERARGLLDIHTRAQRKLMPQPRVFRIHQEADPVRGQECRFRSGTVATEVGQHQIPDF